MLAITCQMWSCDLNRAHDVVRLFHSVKHMPSALDGFTRAIAPFVLRFAFPKLKSTLQAWMSIAPNLLLDAKEQTNIDRFGQPESFLTKDDLAVVEVGTLISKTQVACFELKHLWPQPDNSLKLKGYVCRVWLRSVLLHDCETWSLHAEDVRRPEDFDHQSLQFILAWLVIAPNLLRPCMILCD